MRLLFGSLVIPLFAVAAMAQERHPFGIADALAIADVGSPALSPDGEWVVYTVSRLDLEEDASYSNLYRVAFEGGPAVPLTSSRKSDSRPRFSPDGRHLGFLSNREGDKTQVYVLDLRGGEPIRVTALESGVSDFRWSPDSKKLVVVSRDPDPNADAEGDGAEKTKPPLVINRLQFKRDGRGYLDERRNHLYIVDVDPEKPLAEARQLTEGPYDDGEPVWSPDGRELAFVSNRTDNPDANDNTDIFLVPAAGGEPRRLTTNPGADRAPSFSSDGTAIAYLSVLEPDLIWYALDHLAVVPADGGTPRVLSGALDRNVRRPRFSSDGEHVLFLLEDSGNQHLARLRADGAGEMERLVTGDVQVTDLAEGDGGRIALVSSTPDLPAEIFAWSASDGAPRRLTRTNDDVLSAVRLASVETIQFKSEDGTDVEGFVTKPADFDPAERYPTVLWIHGGPVSQYATSFNEIWQVFAGAGYVVVSANPRGSSGYGEAFSKAIWADWGNKDFEDVMAAVDHVIAAGYADPARLGVGGWSYGGILTNYVITKTGRFRAAISGASETNYLSCYGTDHYQHEWEKELGLPWENRELYTRLSPLTYVQNVTTPTLVLCGELDWNVPLSQSEQLYQSLKRLGVETTLIIYPGQSHGIRKPSYQEDRYQRYLMWFATHLQEEGSVTTSGSAPSSR